MKKNLKKCSLFIQVSNPELVTYCISPKSIEPLENSIDFVYNVLVDVNNCQPIEIDVLECSNSNFIKINKVVFNGITINNLDAISNFKTYGYIDKPGKYKLKLHTNPVSLSYLTDLLSLTKKDSNNG